MTLSAPVLHSPQHYLRALLEGKPAGEELRRAAASWGDAEWSDILAQIRTERVEGYVAARFSECPNENLMPPEIRLKWETLWNRSRVRVAYILEEFGRVSRGFEEEGIPLIFLKGIYLAQTVYPRPALRPFRDIDALCRPEDVPRALVLLRRLGFHPPPGKLEQWLMRCYFDIPFLHEGPIAYSFEIHWRLAPPVRYAVDEEGVWERSRPWKSENVRALAPEDCLLHLALHATYSYYSLEWCRWRDFETALQKLSPDPALVERRAEEWGATAALWGALQAAASSAPSPMAEALRDRLNVPAWRRDALRHRVPVSAGFLPSRMEREALNWLTTDSLLRSAGSLARKSSLWLRYGAEPADGVKIFREQHLRTAAP